MRVAAVIGCASCWSRDLDGLLAITDNEIDYFAVGLDCPYEGYVKYFATYHPRDIESYLKKRENKKLNIDFKIISHIKNEKKKGGGIKEYPIDKIIPYKRPTGSSSLLACFAAIEYGYNRIVLCGCPLEGKNSENKSYESFRDGWKFYKNNLENKVRSMSGWTADFLKQPNKFWLNGCED